MSVSGATDVSFALQAGYISRQRNGTLWKRIKKAIMRALGWLTDLLACRTRKPYLKIHDEEGAKIKYRVGGGMISFSERVVDIVRFEGDVTPSKLDQIMKEEKIDVIATSNIKVAQKLLKFGLKTEDTVTFDIFGPNPFANLLKAAVLQREPLGPILDAVVRSFIAGAYVPQTLGYAKYSPIKARALIEHFKDAYIDFDVHEMVSRFQEHDPEIAVSLQKTIKGKGAAGAPIAGPFEVDVPLAPILILMGQLPMPGSHPPRIRARFHK